MLNSKNIVVVKK